MPSPLPIHRIEIGLRDGQRDPRGEHVARQISEYLDLPVESVATRDVYHLEAKVSAEEAAQIATEFADPVRQRSAVGKLEGGDFDVGVRVAFKPGVADPVGKSALVAAEDTLGRKLAADAAVYTSTLYLFTGVTAEQAERAALELLANPVIQTITVGSRDEYLEAPPDLTVPRVEGGTTPAIQVIELDGTDEELQQISREGLLALSLAEMQAIRDHFAKQGKSKARIEAGLSGAPTDVELECLAQTWSEHCKHKIFNATIEYEEDEHRETIRSLFATYIRGTTNAVAEQHARDHGETWLVSVFHDNAGVVAFDDRIHLVYKVETHNSPSALDPYGGAITGIVGVNRDPFGTGRGADLLVNVWGYCFGPPDWPGELPPGLLHPRRIREGVHQGVIDGGNQSGIPYGRGWELFDHRYLGKPLVFCGTVGALPVTIDGHPGEAKAARPGDRVVMVGGRIGADGIHGATFSSAALDETSPSQAVQIGDPITQRMMFDFLLEARDLGLYNAITDNGAGGLSSSVGEMAEMPGGASLDLARAPLKYAGLAPWEIFLSEAQERMTLAVPPDKLEQLLALAERREVEATDLGEFTAGPVLEVLYGDDVVGLLDMAFLHGGCPEMVLPARWSRPECAEPEARAEDCGEALLGMLAGLNLASNEDFARHYDHEVKALTVVKPWVGVEQDVPAEATVFLARHGSRRGFVLSEGVNPYLSDLDSEAMAATVVDEAVRRQLCAGGRLDRIAALDNFCWPDSVLSESTPDGEYKLAQLVRACRGLHDTCVAYGVPLISGKDSMKNDAVMGGVKISVPPTLLVSAIGQIDDVEQALTLDFKQPGDAVYVVGETGGHTGGSEYFRWLGGSRPPARPVMGDGVTGDGVGEGLAPSRGSVGTSGREPRTSGTATRRYPSDRPAPYVGNRHPVVDAQAFLSTYKALSRAIEEGLIRSAATPTKGGLAVSLAKCCLAAGLGVSLALDRLPGAGDLDADVALFSESNGRFLVSVGADDCGRFEELLADVPLARVGEVSEEPNLAVARGDEPAIEVSIDDLRAAYHARRSDV